MFSMRVARRSQLDSSSAPGDTAVVDRENSISRSHLRTISPAALPIRARATGDVHPEQDYFADEMVEDIVTGLSRIKWLFVIARNSSFTYKGKAVDVVRGPKSAPVEGEHDPDDPS